VGIYFDLTAPVRFDLELLSPCGLREVQLDLIDVAPPPRLAGLERLHDRVLRAMKVFCRMLVFRRIAATHMPALQAQSQMYPRVTHLQAFFAPVGCAWRHVPNFIHMRASFHSVSSLTVFLSAAFNLTPRAKSVKAAPRNR
jgi:hypothetical protein